jgi:hypothetical protein
VVVVVVCGGGASFGRRGGDVEPKNRIYIE